MTNKHSGRPVKDRPVIENAKWSNQWIADPRQNAFIEYFFDNKSVTFSNAYQSALRAKYDDDYAKQITSRMPQWLLDKVKEADMVSKAEKNLKKVLDIEDIDDVRVLHIQTDVSKFITERLAKDRYSLRK